MNSDIPTRANPACAPFARRLAAAALAAAFGLTPAIAPAAQEGLKAPVVQRRANDANNCVSITSLGLDTVATQKMGVFLNHFVYFLTVSEVVSKISDGNIDGVGDETISQLAKGTVDYGVGFTFLGPYAALFGVGDEMMTGTGNFFVNQRLSAHHDSYKRQRLEDLNQTSYPDSGWFKPWVSQGSVTFDQWWGDNSDVAAEAMRLRIDELKRHEKESGGFFGKVKRDLNWLTGDTKSHDEYWKKYREIEKGIDWNSGAVKRAAFQRMEGAVIAEVLRELALKRRADADKKWRRTSIIVQGNVMWRGQALQADQIHEIYFQSSEGGKTNGEMKKGNQFRLDHVDLPKLKDAFGPRGRGSLVVVLKDGSILRGLIDVARRLRRNPDLKDTFLYYDVGAVALRGTSNRLIRGSATLPEGIDSKKVLIEAPGKERKEETKTSPLGASMTFDLNEELSRGIVRVTAADPVNQFSLQAILPIKIKERGTTDVSVDFGRAPVMPNNDTRQKWRQMKETNRIGPPWGAVKAYVDRQKELLQKDLMPSGSFDICTRKLADTVADYAVRQNNQNVSMAALVTEAARQTRQQWIASAPTVQEFTETMDLPYHLYYALLEGLGRKSDVVAVPAHIKIPKFSEAAQRLTFIRELEDRLEDILLRAGYPATSPDRFPLVLLEDGRDRLAKASVCIGKLRSALNEIGAEVAKIQESLDASHEFAARHAHQMDAARLPPNWRIQTVNPLGDFNEMLEDGPALCDESDRRLQEIRRGFDRAIETRSQELKEDVKEYERLVSALDNFRTVTLTHAQSHLAKVGGSSAWKAFTGNWVKLALPEEEISESRRAAFWETMTGLEDFLADNAQTADFPGEIVIPPFLEKEPRIEQLCFRVQRILGFARPIDMTLHQASSLLHNEAEHLRQVLPGRAEAKTAGSYWAPWIAKIYAPDGLLAKEWMPSHNRSASIARYDPALAQMPAATLDPLRQPGLSEVYGPLEDVRLDLWARRTDLGDGPRDVDVKGADREAEAYAAKVAALAAARDPDAVWVPRIAPMLQEGRDLHQKHLAEARKNPSFDFEKSKFFGTLVPRESHAAWLKVTDNFWDRASRVLDGVEQALNTLAASQAAMRGAKPGTPGWLAPADRDRFCADHRVRLLEPTQIGLPTTPVLIPEADYKKTSPCLPVESNQNWNRRWAKALERWKTLQARLAQLDREYFDLTKDQKGDAGGLGVDHGPYQQLGAQVLAEGAFSFPKYWHNPGDGRWFEGPGQSAPPKDWPAIEPFVSWHIDAEIPAPGHLLVLAESSTEGPEPILIAVERWQTAGEEKDEGNEWHTIFGKDNFLLAHAPTVRGQPQAFKSPAREDITTRLYQVDAKRKIRVSAMATFHRETESEYFKGSGRATILFWGKTGGGGTAGGTGSGSGGGMSGGTGNDTGGGTAGGTGGGTVHPGTPAVRIWAEKLTAPAGNQITVPIRIDAPPSAKIGDINLGLSYDPKILKLTGNIRPGDVAAGALFECNRDWGPGTALLAFAARNGITGRGTLAEVTFQVIGRPGQTSPLNFAITRIDDNAGARPRVLPQSGTLTVQGKADGGKHQDEGDRDHGTDGGANDAAKQAYQRYIAAYNRLTFLMSQGKGNTPDAKNAYQAYQQAKRQYEEFIANQHRPNAR